MNRSQMSFFPMDARRYGVHEVEAIQGEINIAAVATDRPMVSLIDANTWPNRWSGEEIVGDVMLPMMPTRRGGLQATMTALTEAVQ